MKSNLTAQVPCNRKITHTARNINARGDFCINRFKARYSKLGYPRKIQSSYKFMSILKFTRQPGGQSDIV